MLEIINVPNKILRQKSQPLRSINKSTTNFLIELGDTLLHKTNPPGVGLSAVQVGHPIQAFYTYLPRDKSLPSSKWNPDTLELTLYINPQITQASEKMTLGGSKQKPALEGCLSIPHIWGPVYRHQWITLQYLTFPYKKLGQLSSIDQLETATQKFDNFPARVIQHEQDHLNGILFTDHNQKANLPLYFETEEGMQEIRNQKDIINW